jgi:hypothetical protein
MATDLNRGSFCNDFQSFCNESEPSSTKTKPPSTRIQLHFCGISGYSNTGNATHVEILNSFIVAEA